MKVYGFIYTRLSSAELSAFNRSGFQIAFYSQEIIDRNKLSEIEIRIHYPGPWIQQKHSIFFLRLKDKLYLFVLRYKSLPEDRDEFGRGGNFVCQGFIFPPELWKLSQSPLKLLGLVKKYFIEEYGEIFNLEFIDKKTGNFKPVDIPYPISTKFPKLPKLRNEFEWELMLILNKLIMLRGEKIKLLIKGNPVEIEQMLDKIYAYVPDKLKHYISWDSAMDGGNIYFSPLMIAGYSKNKPTGGKVIHVDLDSETIEKGEYEKVLTFQSPFEKWLQKCRDEVNTGEIVNFSYEFSELLMSVTQSKTGDLGSVSPCFLKVNKESIEKKFIEGVSLKLGQDAANLLDSELSTKDKAELLIDNLPVRELMNILEKIVIRKKLSPKYLDKVFEKLDQIKDPKVKIIFEAYKRKGVYPEDLENLNENERLEIIEYLLLVGFDKKDWMVDLLVTYKDTFDSLIAKPTIRQKIISILEKVISKDKKFRKIASLLAKESINQGMAYKILRKDEDPLAVIDRILQNPPVENSRYAKLLSDWAKKWKDELENVADNYDYLGLWLNPEPNKLEHIDNKRFLEFVRKTTSKPLLSSISEIFHKIRKAKK